MFLFNTTSDRLREKSQKLIDKTIDEIFDEPFAPFNRSWSMTRISELNSVEETETHHRIHIAVPGHKAESVSVETDSSMRIVTVVAEPNETSNRFIAKSIQSTWAVPSGLDMDSIDAEVKDGVLIVSLAKVKKKSSGKTVQVKVK